MRNMFSRKSKKDGFLCGWRVEVRPRRRQSPKTDTKEQHTQRTALQLHQASSASSSVTARSLSSTMADTEDAVAAADKQMEERAARAKALLSQRYTGLRTDQVRSCSAHFYEFL